MLIIEDIVLVAPESQIYVGDELRKDEIIRVTGPDDSGVFISKTFFVTYFFVLFSFKT